MNNQLTREERDASTRSITHIRALRTHINNAINQLILFDRVMTNAQNPDLDDMITDKLADIRIDVEKARQILEMRTESIDVVERWMEMAGDTYYETVVNEGVEQDFLNWLEEDNGKR